MHSKLSLAIPGACLSAAKEPGPKASKIKSQLFCFYRAFGPGSFTALRMINPGIASNYKLEL